MSTLRLKAGFKVIRAPARATRLGELTATPEGSSPGNRAREKPPARSAPNSKPRAKRSAQARPRAAAQALELPAHGRRETVVPVQVLPRLLGEPRRGRPGQKHQRQADRPLH